jgi:uncharacterized protein (TIGR00730 family)
MCRAPDVHSSRDPAGSESDDSMQHIAVFCGSSFGADPVFLASAQALGRTIAESGRVLVYGGSRLGLMGTLADAALGAGGKVVGVIPRALVTQEMAHPGLTELVVASSMHERKALMADRADAFIGMAGGLGTMDEFFEIWSWAQLGLHGKPLGLLNTNQLFSPLLTFLDGIVAQGFMRPEHRGQLIVSDKPAQLVGRLAEARPQILPKWPARDAL